MKKDPLRVDFMGIGVAKAGSSSVAWILAQHPQINFSIIKETHFFNLYYDRGLTFYQTFFDTPKKQHKITGEFSNFYMHDITFMKRIKKHFPQTKFLVVLRNPMERTMSHFNNDRLCPKMRKTLTGMSFKEALEKNPRFIEWGLYYKQLKPIFKIIDEKKIKVILLDDLKRNQKKTIKELYSWLGVDSTFFPKSTFRDMVSRPRSLFFHNILNFTYELPHRLSKLLPKSIRRHCDYTRLARRYEQFYRETKQVFSKKPKVNRKLTEQERKDLYNKHFKADINSLERLIKRDLSCWKVK